MVPGGPDPGDLGSANASVETVLRTGGLRLDFDRRRQQPSPKRVPLERLRKVFALYRERYFYLNVLHFHQKLCAEHGITHSYTWVKPALQTAELTSKYTQLSLSPGVDGSRLYPLKTLKIIP